MMECDRFAEFCQKSFGFLVAQGNLAIQSGDHERACSWFSIASRLASGSGFFGVLASSELEAGIKQIALQVRSSNTLHARGAKVRVLHVLSEAYEVYGHTKLCRMWIELDREREHHVILTTQISSVPNNLIRLVEDRGGTLTSICPCLTGLERAAIIRDLSTRIADIVVLHIHMDDVAAVAAFSCEGTTPIVFVNHADHSFWIGRSVTDLVFDIRESGQYWTQQFRRICRSVIVPIPLEVGEPGIRTPSSVEKIAARHDLKLPEQSVILLTVGNPAKYRAVGELCFTSIVERILSECPSTCLVAVGPICVGEWKSLSESFPGRVFAVGIKQQLSTWFRASDLYLEGFPMGSLTALLDAGLAGLACVRSPQLVPLPFCSDGIALNEFPRPANLDEYVRITSELVRNSAKREELGQILKSSIMKYHCADGWRKKLEEGMSFLPKMHNIYDDPEPMSVPIDVRDFFSSYVNSGSSFSARREVILLNAITAISERNLMSYEEIMDQFMENFVKPEVSLRTSAYSAVTFKYVRSASLIKTAIVRGLLNAIRIEQMHGTKSKTVWLVWNVLRYDATHVMNKTVFAALVSVLFGKRFLKKAKSVIAVLGRLKL